MIGRSGPIDAGGDGPQRAKQASSMGFGREGAICEYDKIMQILPGSSDDALLINASRMFGNMPTPISLRDGWHRLYINSGTSRFLNSRRSSHKLKPACSVVVAIDRYQACSIRKPGIADRKISGTA
jgi:hypothetical protein